MWGEFENYEKWIIHDRISWNSICITNMVSTVLFTKVNIAIALLYTIKSGNVLNKLILWVHKMYKTETHSVVKHFLKKCVKTCEIHKIMQDILEDSLICHLWLYKCVWQNLSIVVVAKKWHEHWLTINYPNAWNNWRCQCGGYLKYSLKKLPKLPNI